MASLPVNHEVVASISRCIPNISVQNVLGKGNFGVVHKAQLWHQGRMLTVAIKSYDIKQLNGTHSAPAIAKLLQKLDEEIKSLEDLTSDSILKFYGHYEDTRSQYRHLVLDFCEGGDLEQQLVKKQSPFLEFQVKEWCHQLLDGLIEMETKNIVHRDIKPANIFLKNQKAILGDFGLVKHDLKKSTTTVAGSGVFMAPEVGGRVGHNCKADVWSLGVTLYMLLFGKDPWNTYDAFKKGPVANKPKRSKLDWSGDNLQFDDDIQISDGMKQVLKRMIVYDPKQRASWDELTLHPYLQVRSPGSDFIVINTDPFEDHLGEQMVIVGNGQMADSIPFMVQGKSSQGSDDFQYIETEPPSVGHGGNPIFFHNPVPSPSGKNPQNAVTGANFFINRSNCSKVFHLSQDALATCARKRDVYHSGLWRLCGFLRVVVSHANRELVADALDMISDRRQPSEVATSFGPFYDNSDFGEVRTKLEKRRDEAATAVAESEKWLHSNSVSAEESIYLEAVTNGKFLSSSTANQIANKVAHVLWDTAFALHQKQELLEETLKHIKQGLIRVHLCLTYQQAMEFRDAQKQLVDWEKFSDSLQDPVCIERDFAKALTYFAAHRA